MRNYLYVRHALNENLVRNPLQYLAELQCMTPTLTGKLSNSLTQKSGKLLKISKLLYQFMVKAVRDIFKYLPKKIRNLCISIEWNQRRKQH